MLCNDARALFPGLKNKIFLDAACVSLVPSTASQAISKFLDMASSCPFRDASEHHIAMDAWRAQTLEYAATLFNIAKSQIALVESTTHGLNIAVNAINFKADDEVIIANTEFLQVAIPFVKKQDQNLLKIVPLIIPKNNHINIDIIKPIITSKTKAICISAVQWSTGSRVCLQDIGDYCRKHNIWLIVDGVQEAGALNVDLSKIYCDFYVAGGHKWLNSPYGCGLMIMSSRALELQPNSFGYLALSEPKKGWAEFFRDPEQSPLCAYDFAPVAKSFEIAGTSNYPGAIGLGEAIKILSLVGIKNIQEQVLNLSGFLQEELLRRDFNLISPQNNLLRSGITVFRISEDPVRNLNIVNKLLDQDILISMRYSSGIGGIRVSTHYFNNNKDIQILLDALDAITRP
jgi:selenocysteine lyase/cysteine desulfurase